MARVDDLSKYRRRKQVPEGASDEAERPQEGGNAVGAPDRGEAKASDAAEKDSAATAERAKRKRAERQAARARRREQAEPEGKALGPEPEEDDIFGEMTLPGDEETTGPSAAQKPAAKRTPPKARARKVQPETPEREGAAVAAPPQADAEADPDRKRSARRRRSIWDRLRGFLPLLLVVGLPTLGGVLYYGFIASDLYYTETRISVRSPGSGQTPSLMSSAMGGIQLGSASIEADSIVEFATSHDAVRQLLERVDLRAVFSREEGDLISRLSSDAAFEDLVEHFGKRVEVVYNETSGIITVGARTYRPEDSREILAALNDISERLVNTFNRRAEADALRLARNEVERAEQRMADVRSELLRFRLSNQELDPEQRSGGILSIISGLEAEYADVAAQLGEQSAYMDPNSMQVTALRNRLQAIEQQIRAEEKRLTGGEDGERRYANVLNDYELLMLERELAHQEYTSAIASLESARVEAQRQQVYLVPIVEPHEAEIALYPRRAENIGLVFLASLLIFLIGRLIVTGIQDHLMN